VPLDLSQRASRALYRRIIVTMRWQICANGIAGQGYRTTGGAIADAVQMTPEAIAEELQHAWLVIVTPDPAQPVAAWTVEEDGE
jgi:hypothetical protein